MHQAFLQAIRDEPQDDVPRLIYADWLEDNGQADRAEFIRVQIELRRVKHDRGQQLELLARFRRLILEHKADWQGPLARSAPEALFDRGFIENVTIGSSLFLDRAEEIFACHPILSVRLTSVSDRLGELALCPHLAGLRSLDLSDNPLDDAGVQALARSPYLGRLQELLLRRTNLGEIGLASLVSSPSMAQLTTLVLAWNDLADTGVAALVRNLRLPNLARLDLSSNALGDPTAALLAGTPSLRSLKSLLLRGNDLSREAIEQLASSANLENLTLLDVSGNLLDAYREGSYRALRQRYGSRLVL